VISPTPAAQVAAIPTPPAAAAAIPSISPAAKGTVAAAPSPTPKAQPSPTPKATPTPAPPVAAKPQPTPTAVKPAATPAPPVAPARASTDGYAALKAGRLAEAATAFESAARSRQAEFSIQLLVACAPQTIEKALANDVSPDLFALPVTIGGKSCHRLMRGYYKSAADATAAIATLPPYYAVEGAKPKGVQLKTLLP
jgi:hypothetical protein